LPFAHRENLLCARRRAESAFAAEKSGGTLFASSPFDPADMNSTICQIVRKALANEESKKTMLTATPRNVH
jgi:hypothetical protein